MVKEEVILHQTQWDRKTKTLIFQIADDDQLLPGVEGKIVVWVEEE